MTNHHRIVQLYICLIFATIAIWFRFSFHNWKCENTSFIVWTVVVFYWLFWEALDNWFITWLQKIFSNLCPLAYSYLDCAFGSVWLLSLWAWRLTGYIWSYKGYDSFGLICFDIYGYGLFTYWLYEIFGYNVLTTLKYTHLNVQRMHW